MNLIWHIVAKDLRRTAPAALVWVASLLGVALWFWHGMRVSPHHVVSRFSSEEVFMAIIRGMQSLLALLMIGNAVLEDRIVGTDAFWLTRPIRRGHLLAGKAVSGALLFIVAPLAGLIPLWLGLGFSAEQASLAALEFLVPMTLTLAFALMVGGLASGLGNFLFLAILLAVAHVVSGAFAPTRALTEHESTLVRQSRNMLIQYGALPGMLLVTVHQFLTRHRRRSFALVGGLLLLTLAVRLAWPWVLVNPAAPTWSEARAATADPMKGLEKPDEAAGSLGEMPARLGAALRNQSSRTEIVDIVRDSSDRVEAILVRERDAWLFFRDGGVENTESLARKKGAADAFLLKLPGGATPRQLANEEAGVATYASLLVAARKLHLPPDLWLTQEQLAQATLVKLRFDPTQQTRTQPAENKNP